MSKYRVGQVFRSSAGHRLEITGFVKKFIGRHTTGFDVRFTYPDGTVEAVSLNTHRITQIIKGRELVEEGTVTHG
jgi:hypothetical protein